MNKMERGVESVKSKPNDEKESRSQRGRLLRQQTKFVIGAPQRSRIASLIENAMTQARYRQTAAKRENSYDLADRIERSGLDTREARALPARLRSCRPYHRCHSPACQECGPVERLLMALVVEEFVGDHENECFITFVTIIPRNSSVPKGSLHEFSLLNFKRRVRDGLAKTSALWAVGSVDFTLNEHQDDLYASHWSPHVHLIVGAANINKLTRDLRAAFPRCEQAPRPVMVNEWDGIANAFSYIFKPSIFKPSFNRRISIEQTERFNPKTMRTRLCRATTYDRLRVSECIELALFLDAMGLGGRLSFRNVRLWQANNSTGLQLMIT